MNRGSSATYKLAAGASYLDFIQAVLVGTVGLFAVPKFQQCAANWHAALIELM